jgi:CheY-like chemotaxis protein
MEALGQLTGGVAHDFNNLLMIVGGHIRTLKKFIATDPKGARAVEAIERAAERGATLTRQLLTFSRRQTHQPIVAEIGERIEAFHTLLAGSIGASVKLISDISAEVWPVKIDPSEFELAVLNLALNARDAMPQGGIVTISAENVRLAANDTPARLEGDFVALSIADTGSGIAPDIIPRVFDPFFTTKRASEGSGLGLSQVHGFAHQLGGTVTIRSELGHGTCVTLYLPRASTLSKQADFQGAVEQLDGGPALLVEDNPEVAEISAQMIKELGYDVQIASSASAALELIDRVPFQLVVSDIVMAGSMDGIGLARAVRQRRPDLPIVLVTGYSTGAAAGMEFTVLRKPYHLSDLSRAMAKAITEVRSPAPSNIVRLHDARREAGHGQSGPTDKS